MAQRYYLEGYLGNTRHAFRYDLTRFPVVVGRHDDCELQLNVDRVSRHHAKIELHNQQIILTDLNSTNGTFVNHEPIQQPTVIEPGYVVHFGGHEFRLMVDQVTSLPAREDATHVGFKHLSNQFPLQTREFFDLLREKQVRGFMQLITRADGTPYGYELLGRGANPALSESPAVLFNLAENLDAAVVLSRLFRLRCFEDASQANITTPLFFNTHPEESRDFDMLLGNLQGLRERFPKLNLVFEVHEAAITDLAAMAEVRRELTKLNIALAYDDFGAGQTRLLELIEVPPDYLKFDIALVRDIEYEASPRYNMLLTLNTMIKSLGVLTLAEGIETEACAKLCRKIGIDFFQGFLYGRPEPIIKSPNDPTKKIDIN